MCGLLSTGTDSFIESVSSFLNFAKSAFLEHFTIADAVDIILLTILFALVIKFAVNKKAGALIVGIFVCLTVYALASFFDLTGIRYILSGIFQIGALALVIIFQPEIRELLEKLGSGSLNGIRNFGDSTHGNKMKYKNIDSICKAVHILSMQKTGALIAIAKNTSLDDIIHTGTLINADISDTLIRNLFYDKSPLHDGAVIVDNGRIVSAACILPLTKRTVFDFDLGTRHRAAIGLSETSDAIVIVVSEETGIISVAKDSVLTREFTNESLRQLLISELIKEDRR